MRPSFSRKRSNRVTNPLKSDAGRDLAVRTSRLYRGAAAIVIVIEIAEADLGIDSPGDLTAEPAVAWTVTIEPTSKRQRLPCRHIKSFSQIVASADPR